MVDVYIQYSLAVADSFDTLSRLIALQQVSNESKLITAGTRQNVFSPEIWLHSLCPETLADTFCDPRTAFPTLTAATHY